MKVTAIVCKRCKQAIYPRIPQDLRACSCGGVSIVAHPNCFRISSQGMGSELVTIQLPNVTQKDLKQDFKEKKNKYGLLKNYLTN